MTSAVHQAREVLGHRLRELRRDAGLTGVQLAERAGWHSSKVSKIEYGKQTPSEENIRTWCQHTNAGDQVPDLVATVRHVEAMYVESRRALRTGTKRRQRAVQELEAQTRLMRWYEPVLVPGILHTAGYAEAVMRRVIDFYQVPDDLDAGVAVRLQRQQILYRGDRRFHFIIAQQALSTTVGDTDVMIGQLDRLLAVMSLPRVVLGIIPTVADYLVPTNQFTLYDNRRVQVETISAELTITPPREIALYAAAFDALNRQAVYGPAARNLITDALNHRRNNRNPEDTQTSSAPAD